MDKLHIPSNKLNIMRMRRRLVVLKTNGKNIRLLEFRTFLFTDILNKNCN